MSLLHFPIKPQLAEAFFRLEEGKAQGFEELTDVVTDSRKVSSQSLFFALPGVASNGWDYLPQVAALGCRWVVVPTDVELDASLNLQLIRVADVISTLAAFLRQFSDGYPQRIIAVTGTNGKSSISYYSAQIAQFMGEKAAIIGTFGIGVLGDLQEAKQTTPDLLSLHKLVMQQAKDGITSLTFEASSHALDQRRIEGIPIQTAIFSNLSRDHLDYHGTMEKYAEAKSHIFKQKSVKRGVIFLDDAYSSYMLAAAISPVYTYSLKDSTADFYANNIQFSATGVNFSLKAPSLTTDVFLPLLGEFNVANAVAALAANWDFYSQKQKLIEALSTLAGAPGRMQQVHSKDKPLVVVDYAHTPDALSVALQALHQHTHGRVICIYGCGGDRDRGKRPLMTQAAIEQADIVYLTSDNPRTEDPSQIMQDAVACVNDVELKRKNQTFFMIEDRHQAIATAISSAQAGDTILIAGKGHENYQDIMGVKHHFDDLEEAQKVLAQC